jgi:preprotein translocase subunit SecB
MKPSTRSAKDWINAAKKGMKEIMSENNDIQPGEDVGEIRPTPLIVHKQYLKDLSFENPNAPGILNRIDQRPVMDMNIGLDVQKLEAEEHEHYYEVLIKLTATAKRVDEAMFLAEVVYGAACSIQGMDEKRHHPLLFIEVPRLIFPFARQILSMVTQNGGFMPLQLAPVDFNAMYLKRFGQGQGAQQEEQTGSADAAE